MAAAPSPPGREPLRSLEALVGALEQLALAVARHDHAALSAATAEATALVELVERQASDGLGLQPAGLDRTTLDELTRRLDASARRAALLIERAWSSEAAAIQLLARLLARDGAELATYDPLGHAAATPMAGGRSAPTPPLVVERQA